MRTSVDYCAQETHFHPKEVSNMYFDAEDNLQPRLTMSNGELVVLRGQVIPYVVK